jgi:hypothetical protein
MADDGVGNAQAIMAAKRHIEALPLNRDVEPSLDFSYARGASGLKI